MVDDASPFIGIDVRHDDGREVIALVGDLDLAAIDAVRNAVYRAPGIDVRLDLSGVEYMDSSGLSLLIAEHRRLESEERRLVLREPSEPVRQLLKISGLDGYLHVELVGC